ncbi:MAG TPA: quinolinate synthase NadA [Bacillota bacterium]
MIAEPEAPAEQGDQPLDQTELAAEARRLKDDRQALILAHVYQRPEVQDLADFVGDSLGLSQQAAWSKSGLIIFGGVHFMAESAAILSPKKTVILPEPKAGCPMADMVTGEGLRAMKEEYPGVPVVAYVNTSAAVKAESDICCTSRNAVKVVESIPGDSVIFVPDRNLAHYVQTQTKKKIIPWPGFCPTHNRIKAEDVRLMKEAHPRAVVLVHPEADPAVVGLADEVFSTEGMLRFVRRSPADEFIIGTEMGILHPLQKDRPDASFYFPSGDEQICPNMKSTTLRKLVRALVRLEPRVTVPEDIRVRAQKALDRMLTID